MPSRRAFTARLWLALLLSALTLAGSACKRESAPVNPPPDLDITTTALPEAVIMVEYSFTLRSTGGLLPLNWSIAGGALPPGLTLDGTTATISGTPTQVGIFNFTVRAADSSMPALTDTQDLSLDVRDAIPIVELISQSSSGELSNGDSGSSAVSADGRYVVFSSFGSNLVPDDFNNVPDVFIRDRLNQTTARVSFVLHLGNQTADLFTATTIGNSTLAMRTDEHVGRLVEIVAGTGSGQSRRVVTNDATTLTVDSAWTTTPDSSSEFRVASGGPNFAPAISADGRFVAYTSSDSNLVPEDLNGVQDVFVTELDLSGPTPVPLSTRRVSVGLNLTDQTADIFGADFIGNSGLTMTTDEHKDRLAVIVAGTGVGQVRWIAANDATTLTLYEPWLTPPDGTSVFRVISDATRGTNLPGTLADIFSANTIGNSTLMMTDNEHAGRMVAILAGSGKGQLRRISSNSATTLTVSPGWNPVPDDTSVFRVFTDAAGGSNLPFLSNDGQVVAFQSAATTLVANDTTLNSDIFVHTLATGDTTRVSVRSDGSEQSGDSHAPFFNHDASLVAFQSLAQLVPEDTALLRDIFLHDRGAATTTRVNLAPDGSAANSTSTISSLSPSGRFVLFHSFASNLVAGDTNGFPDLFLRDLVTAETTRVNLANDGSEADGNTDPQADISGAGRLVVFVSSAANLVAGDINAFADVFLRDRQAGTTTRVSQALGGAQPNSTSSDPVISADASVVAFSSTGTNFFLNDSNNARDVFAVTTGASDSPFIVIFGETTTQVGQPYSLTATAFGGEKPLFWTVAGGQLPPGLTLDPQTGEIRGLPSVAGRFRFTLLVFDDSRPRQTAARGVTLLIQP